MNLLFIGLGGAFGACSRYLLSELCVALLGRGFPFGTLLVNVSGSLAMGVLMALISNGSLSADPWRYIFGLGFLGALTTFSTFSMDTVTLLQQGAMAKACLNILINVVLSILAVLLGFQLFVKAS